MAFVAQSLKDIIEENLLYVFNGSKPGEMDEKFSKTEQFEYIVLGSIVKREVLAEIPDLAKRLESTLTLAEGVEEGHKLSDYADFQTAYKDSDVCTAAMGLLFDYCQHFVGKEGWESEFDRYDDIVIPKFTIPKEHIADHETYLRLLAKFMEGMIGENGIVQRFGAAKIRLDDADEEAVEAARTEYNKVLEDAEAVYKPWLSYLLLVIVQNPDLMRGAIGNFKFLAKNKNTQSDIHVFMHRDHERGVQEPEPTFETEAEQKEYEKRHKPTKTVRFQTTHDLYKDDYERKGQEKFHWRIETILRHRVNVEGLSEAEYLAIVPEAADRLKTMKVQIVSHRNPEPEPEPEPVADDDDGAMPIVQNKPGRRNRGQHVDLEKFVGGQERRPRRNPRPRNDSQQNSAEPKARFHSWD